jgi:hypothetical protein
MLALFVFIGVLNVLRVIASPTRSVYVRPNPVKVLERALPSPTNYQNTALYHHDIHRQNHSASNLAWSATYAGYAQTLAKGCMFREDT